MSGLLEDVAPPMCALQTECDLGAILRFYDIPPEIQCPKTTVGQNDQFSVSAYYRSPEGEPDVESGLQEYFFATLPRLQTLRPRLRSAALLLFFPFQYQISWTKHTLIQQYRPA